MARQARTRATELRARVLSELNLSVIPVAVCAVRPCVSCGRHVGLLFWKRRRSVMLRAAFHMLRVAIHMLCCALHFACCALHSTCCALHSTCCVLHLICCALHSACCTLHFTCCALHFICCALLVSFGSPGVALLLEAACSTCALRTPAAASPMTGERRRRPVEARREARVDGSEASEQWRCGGRRPTVRGTALSVHLPGPARLDSALNTALGHAACKPVEPLRSGIAVAAEPSAFHDQQCWGG